MEKRIRYCTVYSKQLVKLLEDYQVPYSRSDGELRENGFDYLMYTISERHPQFALLSEQFHGLPQVSILESVRYSEQERLQAEWLTVRAITAKVELCREEETFACSGYYQQGDKAHHRVLTGAPFYLTGPLRHSRHQNFFCSDEATDHHIFCTERARQVLESAEAEINFARVLYDSTGDPVADLYYLAFRKTLPAEAVVSDNCPEEYLCPCCGQRTFFPPIDPLKVKGKDLAGCRNACKTAEIFSSGGNFAYPLNLISQALYRLLKENMLLRGLEFAPVEIV